MVRSPRRALASGLAIGAGAAVLGLLPQLTATARANPRPLPFTYQSESLAQGTAEVEQFLDFVPIRVQNAATGAPVWYNATQLQTEIEYGVTDKLEVALYFMFVPGANPEQVTSVPLLPMGNGSSQRIRYRFADPQAWPVDVAVYGEVTENEREIELEAKIILQRRIRRLRLITNLWAEREFYFSGAREWVLNPTAGATLELSPRFHVGLEGWMRAEFPDGLAGPRVFNLGPHVFVGPTFMVNLGPVWWATGAYARVTDPSRPVHAKDSCDTCAVSDAYGRIWVRTVVGIGF